jgi:peroxiredoxin
MKTNIILTILLWISILLPVKSQSPVTIGEPMPDFTLASYQGPNITLSALKGKNVMLVFPRGKVSDHWCQICHYQYAELADLEKTQDIRKKYNLEILFVLPYNTELVKHWVSIFPDQMKVIDKWKNPPKPDSLNEGQKNWMELTRKLFPKKYEFTKENLPTPFPILIDENRELSMKLGIFTTYWDGSYVEQNISSIFILDKEGKVQFKYVSQTTFDRPKCDYLLNIMNCFLIK